jgi:hypothetical protein
MDRRDFVRIGTRESLATRDAAYEDTPPAFP